MRYIILMILTLPVICFAQTADSTVNKLNDVVIQAQYQRTLEEDKLPLALGFDYSKEAVIENNISWASLNDIEKDSEIPQEDQHIHPHLHLQHLKLRCQTCRRLPHR